MPGTMTNRIEVAGSPGTSLESETGQLALLRKYRDDLLEDTLPFWVENPHFVDRERGGYLCALDRDGTLLDTDKGMWQQARVAWLFSRLYNTLEPRREWLDLAEHGLHFIRSHGYDSDGRMFFRVTRDGQPLIKRRYVFTELFTVMALAEHARASGDERSRDGAEALFDMARRYLTEPGLLPAKVIPTTRQSQALATPMILIVCAQVMREVAADGTRYTKMIDEQIEVIRTIFMRQDVRAVMEQVDSSGDLQTEHFDGRILCPGHSIETAWFILEEARYRGSEFWMIETAETILDWMWDWGWDSEHGGIFYYRDVHNLPVQEYWQDMKFWWVHNEAIIATLMAFVATGNVRHANRHQLVHDWSHKHFHDQEYGEWYGYLHRDGRISVPLKGNLWKAPFHLPRMQLQCISVLTDHLANRPIKA